MGSLVGFPKSGKMSKRDALEVMNDGYSIFLKDFQFLGYLPEAVANWIALIGWSYDDHTEIFSMKDLVEKFSIKNLNPSPAAINFTKLDHFNGVHIRNLTTEDLAARVAPYLRAEGYQVDSMTLLKVIPLIRERLVTLDDSISMAGFFFREQVSPKPEDLVGKDLSAQQTTEILVQAREIIEGNHEFSAEWLEQRFRDYVDQSDYSIKQVFGILRVAITGQRVSPPLFESMEIVGKEKVMRRLELAARLLESGG